MQTERHFRITDGVYPDRVKMDFPVLLDMEVPEIYAYSISSVISEKFEAIVSLGDANSRYKDFYDICILVDVVDLLRALLLPIVDSITDDQEYAAKWDHEFRSGK